MQFHDRINAIETRASVVNMSLFQLCRVAKVDYTRVYRWKTGENSPTVHVLEKHLGALEGTLCEVEERILKALSPQGTSAHSGRAA